MDKEETIRLEINNINNLKGLEEFFTKAGMDYDNKDDKKIEDFGQLIEKQSLESLEFNLKAVDRLNKRPENENYFKDAVEELKNIPNLDYKNTEEIEKFTENLNYLLGTGTYSCAKQLDNKEIHFQNKYTSVLLSEAYNTTIKEIIKLIKTLANLK